MSTSFGVDFGQKVDLTASIRNILRNYPEGTAVLKELVQNADDAGASTVVFYLDYRNHSSTKLADRALEAFQGPSLLVYNDAIFTAEDFNSIQRIGDSLKKSSEESRAKIGRFGIGFNAVYHWTDLPSFISSNYLVMLDPQARFLPNVNPSNPGKMVDWITTPNIVKQFPDQFKPYEIDGLSWATPFKGTLFRLPLRTTEQAKSSLLSKRALSVTDAAALLNALRVEASAMLLFLKSVTKIEIREWKPSADTSIPSQSSLVYSCRVTNTSAEMMRKRCLVSDKTQLQALSGNVTYAMAADYTLHIECTTASATPGNTSASNNQFSTTYTEHWEICNQLGGPSANLIAAEPENALLRLIPWAGVAACVSVTTPTGAEISAELVQNATIRDGLAYCFLPLPVRTGLPVMVNGFFELSSNRRDVWQAGADMTGDGRTRALWNISIMKDLIAPSYSRMLVRLRDILGFSAQYQALWPNIRTVGAPWDEVVRATLTLSRDLKLLRIVTMADFTAVTDQTTTDVATVTTSDNTKSKALGLFAGFGVKNKSSTKGSTTNTVADTWISCRAAVLLPLGLNASTTSSDHNDNTTVGATTTSTTTSSTTSDGDELTSYLVRAQASLVLTTETLKITLLETQTCTITATPEFVRTVLRSTAAGNGNNNNTSSVPLPQMCKFLLKYCFSDLNLHKQKQLTSAMTTALHNLPVLPVSDESVAVLRIFSDAQINAIQEVTSMGFSLSQTVYALTKSNFDILGACEELSNTASSSSTTTISSVLLLLDEPQLKVFHLATPVLLNRSYIAPNELEILTLPSLQKYSNVRTFNAQFIPDLLRYILPPACYHNHCTAKADLSANQHTQLCEFLSVFWKYASTRAEVVTAIAQNANVVPALGLTSFYPLSRMANLIVRTKGDITLSSEICDVLSVLGVQFVDPLALPDGAMMPAVFWEYVLSPTRSGVLVALDCVLRNNNNTSSSTSSSTSTTSSSNNSSNVFRALSAQQKDALRLYLATAEPVRQLTEKECAIVRNLPIFASCQKEPLQGSSVNSDEPVLVTKYVAIGDNVSNSKASSGGSNSKNNSRTPYATVVDYAHLPSSILPSHLLQHVNTQDLQLLVHLQVTQLSRAQYFRSEFLPAVQYLYHIHPQECVQTVLTMCDEVKALCESDKHFLELLKSSAFIPCATSVEHITLHKSDTITNNSADHATASDTTSSSTPSTAVVSNTNVNSNNTNTASATRLRRACELFDPTDLELTSLLDIQCFPNNALIPVLQRAELLVLLRNIGLQTSLNWPSIVACARSIADMSDYTTTSDGTVTSNAHKTDRGRSLLKFLDKNITRLMQTSHNDATKKSSTSGNSNSGSVFPLFSFSTLFGSPSKDTTSQNNNSTTATATNSVTKNDVGADNQPMEVYMEQLKLIPWVPVATEALHPCMPWPTTTTTNSSTNSALNGTISTTDITSTSSTTNPSLPLTAAPIDTCPVSNAWLVSSTKRLVTDTIHTAALQRLLGWDESIHVTVIAIQLRELSALYLKLYGNKIHSVYDSPDSNSISEGKVDLDVNLEMQKLRETITGLIPQLYQRLNAAASNNTSSSNSSITYNISSSSVHDILTILESAAWIWVGDIFVTIDRVALNAGINATPYLYQLPQDLQVYTALLQSFQVKQKFNSRDYVEVLRTMAVQTGAISSSNNSGNSMNGEKSGTNGAVNAVRPLSDNHLDICISLVTLLATESNTTSNAALFATLYLPDSNGKLALCDTLINDDVPWLSGPEYISIRAGVRLVHPNISTHVCNVLGVKSLRLTLLSQTLEQSIFTLPTNAVESFGQAESLTNRLKTILDMYPDGNPIFSELIQNADDAGATIVSICIDENSYQCESLLDPKMAALQGPSLIVRNDAMFTESDFKSLAKIGQGSKLNKLNTTGRFGLGFNSTYHITDTPSFVSGDYVVIFDPHCNYVPGATMNQPGVRIRYTNTTLSTTFSDQFKPFHFFGCDLQSKYQGTLFRFPLRTASQARKSEISKRSYTITDVESNLAQLATQLSNMLIFLRNVRTIEVYRCNSHSTTPTLLHRATAKVHSVETVNDQFLLGFFDRNNATVNNGINDVSRDGFYKRLMSTADNLLPKVFSQVHIETDVYSSTATSSVTHPEVAISSNHGVAEQCGSTTDPTTTPVSEPSSTVVSHSTVDYIVSHGLCGGDAKRMACLESLRHFKLVPMGAVAACISKTTTVTGNNSTATDSSTSNAADSTNGAVTTVGAMTTPYPPLQGIAFCYLPLPVLTQLPVHVNGYFELSSNRRDIWKGDDTKGEAKMRSDWNICIMKDVLAPLYAALLVKLHAKAQLSAHTDLNRAGAELSIQQVNQYQQRLHQKLLSLLPCPAPHDPWNNISSALFEHIKNANLLYSELGGGSFVPLKDAYLIEDYSANSNSTMNNSITNSGNVNAQQRVEQLLLQENVPVVRASAAVLQTLIASNTAAGQVNPALVRTLFHINNAHKHPTLGCNNVSAASYKAKPMPLSEECMNNAIFWLQYALSDITTSNGSTNTSTLNNNNDRSSIFASLLGLHLLPLEDNTLGTLQHYTDAPPFFLVNETERRLLNRAGHSLVASEHLLGAQVYNILRLEAFAQVCNVRAITVIDTLKLVTTILPPKWLAAETVCAGRVINNSTSNSTSTSTINTTTSAASTTIVSKEWLFSMWAYIIENNCIAMFTNMFPIIPVVYPKFLPEGEYIVKVSPNIPVLHMTYREIKSDVVCVLALLGVFICDPSVLEGKSYSAEFISLLSPPNARGVLDALVQRVQDLQASGVDLSALVANHCMPECVKDTVLCSNTLHNVKTGGSVNSSGSSAAAQYATQCFILDSVIAKIDALTSADIDVLCALPIWCTYKPRSASATATAVTSNKTIDHLALTYGPLHRHTMQLPPLSANESEYDYLLDQSFLRIRNEQDRVLYQKLGVVQPSMGQFYATHVVQKLQQSNIDGAKIDILSVSILRNLMQLEKESPGLCEKLKQCAFVRSEPSLSNASNGGGDISVGTLQTPISLYDPQAPLLSAFLPAQVFPSSIVYNDVSLYLSLRMLGLQQEVTPDNILFAAKSIQRDFEQTLSLGNPASPEGLAKLENINMHSIGLFSYLEAHIETILKDISPASIHDCDYEKELNSQEGARTSAMPRAPVPPGQLLGGSWGAELRSITWVPVLTAPPVKIVHADLALPWPSRTHVHPIATPSQCNSLSNIWLCSNSHRICSVDTQNAYLLYVLGWDKILPGRCIAGQLLALQQTYVLSSTKMQFSAHSANEVYATVLPLLLTQLTLAYERESPTEIKLWCEALYNKPIVWMQNKFIETSRIAFHSITSIDLEPFLFIARPDLLRYKALLLQLGSRETFEAADLAALMRDLYSAHRDQPLSTYKLTLCVGIVQILYKMVNGEAIETDVPVLPVAEPVGGHSAQGSNGDGDAVDATVSTSAEGSTAVPTNPPAPPVKAKKVLLSELGVIYLPDKHNLLYPSTVLTFDDAPWMSAALHEASNTAATTTSPGIKFVSSRIESTVAMALGCKSLREQLFTGEEVHCPDPHTLRTTLDEDSLRDVLVDLVYVAGCVNSTTLHVYYDARSHPVESLLHPGLAETQGPAILAYLEGNQPVNREVMAMLLSLQNMSTDLFRGAEDQCSPLTSPAAVAMNNARGKFRRATGKKLLTTFAVTDCLQVLSGNEFYVFDPCGKYLLNVGDITSHKHTSGENSTKRLQSKLSRKSVVASAAEPSHNATPRAQHYVINKSAQRDGNNSSATQDALERFPDQFSSFLSLPFAFREQLQQKGRINGMVIRLPLRKEASAVSNTMTSVKDVQVQWGSLRSFVAPALVFAEHLVDVRVSHFDTETAAAGEKTRRRELLTSAVSGEKADSSASASSSLATSSTTSVHTSVPPNHTYCPPTFDLSIKQLTPSSNRRSRYGLVNEKGWKKQGFTTFFAKPFVPPEVMYAVILETFVHCKNEWIVPSPQLSLIMSEISASANDSNNIGQKETNPIHTHQEHWLVAAAHGVAKLRELALAEPYVTMEMQPFVSIALPILEHSQLSDISTPPDAGLYFNAGAAVGHTGLPFHIEGSFFQPYVATTERNVRFGGVTGPVSTPIAAERRNSSITFPAADLQTAGKWTDALVYVAIETLYPKVLFEIKARIEATARSIATVNAATSKNSSTGTNTMASLSGVSKQRLLSGFYKYLPYYPRLTAHTTRVLQSTSLFVDLLQHPLFLQQNGFFYLHESLLPISVLPPALSAYISPILPLALCPQQLAVDLKASKIGNVPALTASNLRATMANNALMHCSRLTNNAHLVSALLNFVLTDIAARSANEGEFTRRKVFREMAGVPLMPMANLNVKTFPRSAAEQVAIAPLILHALLPALKNSFLHPTLTTKITLFSDPLFLETLFISKFNASYMEYNIAAIVPARWRLVPAVAWENGLNSITAVGSAGRNVRPSGESAAAAAPSPLLMYILWNSFLSAESDWNQIERLREYPLIPVVSRNRRLLLSMSLLSTVFADASSSQQDDNRTHLKREIGRMTSLAMASMTLPDAEDSAEQSVTDEWAWTSQPFSVSGDKGKHPAHSSGASASSTNNRPIASGTESDDDLGDTVITEPDFTEPVGPFTIAEASVSAVSNQGHVNIPTAVATELVPEPPVSTNSNQMPPPPPPSQNHSGPPPPPSQTRASPPPPSAAFLASLLAPALAVTSSSSAVNGNIRRILSLLGIPFLDAGILEDVPVVIRGNNTTGEGGANDFSGRRVLQCLHKLNALHVVIQPADSNNINSSGVAASGVVSSGSSAFQEELLCFDELTVADRNALLLLIAVPQHQGMAPLTTTEQSQLKQLRLFTSKSDNVAVSIAECKGGVYWCREEAVLDTISNRISHQEGPSSGPALAPDEVPIVLIYHESLLPVYTLLGIEELTAATAVRRFTVPHLRTMPALARLKVMLSLAAQWDSYRSDQALVAQLKDLPFVPPYNSRTGESTQLSQSVAPVVTPVVVNATMESDGNTLESCEHVSVASLRPAKDVFLWTNDELLDALKGSMQSQYFPPPYMRTAQMHVMCSDLGMETELNEASFKRIVGDIQTTVNDSYSGTIDQAESAQLLREAADRGRSILRYVKANDRISTLLQNKPYAASIGKIKFVPMKVPVSTEAGGYVTYKEEIGRFDMLLARTHGTLAFTVMPIIDEDITPPQFYFSALGITGTPAVETVLRHIRNLTSNGESLDRWNAPYPITATFNAIFQFLSDQWKTLSPKVKESLGGINLVPVGHLLIKPTRLFFRLGEDLSPFMHEIPRLYGAHEQFLKQIGIKESPTVTDYVRFLSDLANECGDCYLNPNELRAVVAILHVIATQSGDAAEQVESEPSNDNTKLTSLKVKSTNKAAELSMLYVPDEHSVMRPISQCLVNDNEWYRGNTAVLYHLHQTGLYLLHPSISRSVAENLRVDALTSVVSEQLDMTSNSDAAVSPVTQAELQQKYTSIVTNTGFVKALATLVQNNEHGKHHSGEGIDAVHTHPRTFAALNAVVQSVRFVFVRRIATKFFLTYTTATGRETIIEFADSNARERLNFLNRVDAGADQQELLVNFQMASTPPLTLNLAVAAGLCQLIGADLSLSYAVAALMESQGAHHLQSVLEALHVHMDDSGVSAESNQQRGVPGERITDEDASLLELRPFRVYRIGEIVAYEVPLSNNSTEGGDISGEKGTPEMVSRQIQRGKEKVYGKIVSIGNASEEGIRRLNVKIGSTVVSVLSTEIFSFKSAREVNVSKNASNAGGLRVPVAMAALKRSVFGSSGAKTSNTMGPAFINKSAAMESAGEEEGGAAGAEVNVASRNELLGAVNGLLARAGVPIDLEQQGMISHILELESAKKRMEKELLAERHQLLQSKEQLENAANKLKCSICCTHDVYYVLVPCGHTTCEQCTDSWHGSGCPICRTRMQSKVRFFLPGADA